MSARRAPEALASARRAVALEPGYWGNQFRHAHAAWGSERLQALARVLDLYPDFPFVHFEEAMVHIARGEPDRAEPVLREGTIVQDRQADLKQRYPAKGLHWLLGLVRLARGDADEAHVEFQREIASGTGQLYAPEFAMNAHDGAGFASLRSGDAAAAAENFRCAPLLPNTPDRWSVWAPRWRRPATALALRRHSLAQKAVSSPSVAAGEAARQRSPRLSTMPRAQRRKPRFIRSTSCSIAQISRSPDGRSPSSRCSSASASCAATRGLPCSSHNARGEQEAMEAICRRRSSRAGRQLSRDR
jgi:tetratricopeptide (TPR) repeat protein